LGFFRLLFISLSFIPSLISLIDFYFLLLRVMFQQAGGVAEFTVTIVACGPTGQNQFVYAITVTQPVQTWTVVRSQDDFKAFGDALSSLTVNIPACPHSTSTEDNAGDLNVLVAARNELQSWLTSVLMTAGVQESITANNFLTVGANTIPAQYEAVPWTHFSTSMPPVSSPPALNSPHLSSTDAENVNVDDMEMDIMFTIDDENAPITQDHQEEDDEDFVPSASIRYKPTDEAVTDEDEMEMLHLANEVEMVDDIGSLAQSLGASHLGRSLQLQAEMNRGLNGTNGGRLGPGLIPAPQQSVNIGGSGSQSGSAVGGIGGAMERAANTASSFNHKAPVSAPRLDSFKMIKVIGKGSFGMFCFSAFRLVVFSSLVSYLFWWAMSQQEKYFS
jgi:hypothetical protein